MGNKNPVENFHRGSNFSTVSRRMNWKVLCSPGEPVRVPGTALTTLCVWSLIYWSPSPDSLKVRTVLFMALALCPIPGRWEALHQRLMDD